MNKIIERFYNSSPAFLQNLAVSTYGWKLYRREYGRKFAELLKSYEEMQWWPYEKLWTWQDDCLKRLITHSYSNVPYYREIMKKHGLTPDDFRSVDDLPKMPLLTRDDIRNNFDSLISSQARRKDLSIGHTSGTTGSPLEFLYDRHINLVKNVVDWRQKRWGGVNPGDRVAFFLGRVVVPITRHKPPFWRHNWVLNHLFFSSFHMSPENLPMYFEQLKKFNPKAIEGYPSTIYILAGHLLSRNKTFPLDAVFTSSETLYPQQREAIERAFECKLYDFFGMAERVLFATECDAHEGHHVNMDFGILEVLNSDGQPCAPGEMGRMVATGLHNFGMPLIRYLTSDVTAIKDKPCSCGRAFPLMEDVTTKAEDIVTTLDGRYVSSSILTHPFKPMHNVAESQIIQEDRENIVIKIIKRPEYSDADSQYLVEEMKKRVGQDMNIELEFVDQIPRTKTGKFRWVISKVPLEF